MPTFAPLLFRLEDNGAREAEHFVSGLASISMSFKRKTKLDILDGKKRSGLLMMPPTISAPYHSGKKED